MLLCNPYHLRPPICPTSPSPSESTGSFRAAMVVEETRTDGAPAIGPNRNPCPSRIIVRPMADSDAVAWDDFVFATSGGTFFHRAGWRRIFRDIFRLNPYYLIAER